MFQNAHKLFGVSNILKILKELNPSQKNEAMNSIIYQANARDRFPVHGCVEIIQQLWTQIRQHEEELHVVHAMLAMYRQQQQHEQYHQQQEVVANHMELSSSPSQLQLGVVPPACSACSSMPVPLYDHNSAPQSQTTMLISQNYSYSGSNSAYNLNYIDTKERVVNSTWIQQCPHSNNNNKSDNSNNNLIPIQSELVASQQHLIQQELFQDYVEMQPYFATVDDRQSYIDPKEVYDSSPESSVKDTTIQAIEHVAENELKSAAACFSLTSVN
ncbi:hypothetical protein Ancab_035858 [Ancistrocladus abbreviatus]